jgi:hypothetical protein
MRQLGAARKTVFSLHLLNEWSRCATTWRLSRGRLIQGPVAASSAVATRWMTTTDNERARR